MLLRLVLYSLCCGLLAAPAHASEPAAPTPANAAPAPAARGSLTATLVEGDVKVTPKGSEAKAIKAGDTLAEGDLIETGADSRLEILLGTGSVLRLGRSTRTELREAPPAGGRFKLKRQHAARQVNFALTRQQRNRTHLAQIHAYRIIRVNGFFYVLSCMKVVAIMHFFRMEKVCFLIKWKTQRLIRICQELIFEMIHLLFAFPSRHLKTQLIATGLILDSTHPLSG